MRTLVALTAALILTGCAGVTTPHQPAGQPWPTFSQDAYKTAAPRSEAYHAACTKKGGHVVGQDCLREVGYSSVIIPIFEDDEARERRP